MDEKVSEKREKEEVNAMTYEEQLRDPRWLKVREEVLKYDKECRYCGSKDNLQVHHIKYISGKMAWEHPLSLLVTLCRRCHEMQHRINLPRGSESQPVKSIRQVMVDFINDQLKRFK